MTSYGPTAEVAAESLGISESGYQGAVIETVRIVNVNIDDWSVDCVSDIANKRFFDIQVMSPYYHFANGEGWYAMPEVGCLAWICKPSMGRMSAPFILGYQAPFDDTNASYRSNRQSLNPGDMMWRTRDENFIILRRGGVVQMGATPICQTMYVPINNIIRHFCEKFEINAFGGELLWETWRKDEASGEDPLTTFYLNVKDRADKKGHIGRLSIGSHGDGNPVKLQLTMYPNSEEGSDFVADLQIDETGNVTWDCRNDWTMVIAKNLTVVTEEENMTFDCGKDFAALAKGNMNLEAEGDWKGASGGLTELIGGSKAIVDAPAIELGNGAIEPVVLGQQFVNFMSTLIGQLAAFQFVAPMIPAPGPPVPVIAAPALSALTGQLQTLLSQVVKTK